ncbi:MAG TPA: OmpH family outer membrane protein [Limnochordia bacterium]|nr:OmpH family outer membrane protein [Limnochordia bacterium]
MKRKTLGIVLVFIMILSLSAVAAAASIGYVDFEFLFYSHPEYEAKNRELQESAERLYNEAQAAAEKLETQEEIDQLAAQYERQFEEIENNVRLALISFILEVIEQVAQEQGIDVVLPESSIIFGGVNLTAPVIEAMYKAYGISVPSSIRELLQQ